MNNKDMQLKLSHLQHEFLLALSNRLYYICKTVLIVFNKTTNYINSVIEKQEELH